jgi:hypothetical protein
LAHRPERDVSSVWIPEIRVEIGLTGPTVDPLVWHIGDAARGQIGTAQIGAEDIWSDITADVRNWSFRRGASRADGLNLRYEAGTLTVELNNGDRAFDPTNLAGPYTSGGVTLLTPMVRVRLTAVSGGVAYPLITAFADSWVPDYNSATWSTTTLTATDAFKIFATEDRAALAVPVGASENSGARINRILDGVGWSTSDRSVATGDTTLQATTLDGNVMSELLLTQDSELGELYMSALGDVVYRNRHALITDTRSNTAQAIFGDAGISAGEIPFVASPVDYDDQTLANRVSITRVGGTEQVEDDLASQAKYLRKTYQRSDLVMETDGEALNYAGQLLSQAKEPELRFSRLDFNVPRAGTGDLIWPTLLGRDLGDRATVRRRPPGGGAVNDRDVFIRGIAMSSDGSDWKVSFNPLQAASRQQFFTIGHPTLGRIGYNAIAF